MLYCVEDVGEVPGSVGGAYLWHRIRLSDSGVDNAAGGAHHCRRPLGSSGPGRISLRAPVADIAADLHHRYGDALDITVGSKPFPPERITGPRTVPLPVSTWSYPA